MSKHNQRAKGVNEATDRKTLKRGGGWLQRLDDMKGAGGEREERPWYAMDYEIKRHGGAVAAEAVEAECNRQRAMLKVGVDLHASFLVAAVQVGHVTKHGNPRLRAALVEGAWRLVRFQPQYPPIATRLAVLAKGAKATGATRKKAIVAVARRLAVDLWRLHTGQCTAEKLGLEM